jgi:hypothetical protein
MPLLLNVLRNAHQKEFRLLRGKAMECASLIGRLNNRFINATGFVYMACKRYS